MAPNLAPTTTIREIRTPLTELLDIQVPICLAPMSTGGGADLAAQVTKCGGFAFIPAGDDTVDVLKKEVQAFKDIINPPPSQQVPVGVGFLAWHLEAGHEDLLACALDLNVKAVCFAFGDHMDRWVKFVQGQDHASGRRTIIFVMVHSAEHAAAVAKLRVDVVIAQGIEAGGIMTGSHIAALLTAGAHGCLLGTRFVMARESYYTPSQRDAMLLAKSNSATERTLAFDEMFMGSIFLETTTEYNAGEPLAELRAKYRKAAEEGDADRIATWAGLGVVLLKEIQESAENIMRELTEECFARLKAVGAIVDH
ncbi:hypothetical protein B0H17DRAFT_1062597 [Mycena rosella]|uniref:Nitronate monooxygenase domain-containing protein n=1 Tax=Mycena rosella TaxID=1033263 RepID=A0AAD7DKM6_MYCRO|nr:hypothetical protein B0H17DRAFT_1062597 [Mycena rosella]